MSRRKFLMLAGAGIGTTLAGCLDDNDGEADGTEPEATDGTGETTGGDTNQQSEEDQVETDLLTALRYRTDNVLFVYEYTSGADESPADVPQEVVLHTGESPESGDVITEVDNPQDDFREELSFDAFGVDDRSELPESTVTITFEDGSTEAVATASADDRVSTQTSVNVERSAETGETTVTGTSFDSDYVTVSSPDNTFRIDEEGGSITIPPEDAYTSVDDDAYIGNIMYEVYAHYDGGENRVEVIDTGFPEPETEIRDRRGDRAVVFLSLHSYDEVTVAGNIAVGSQDVNEELEIHEETITEPQTVVFEDIMRVLIERNDRSVGFPVE